MGASAAIVGAVSAVSVLVLALLGEAPALPGLVAAFGLGLLAARLTSHSPRRRAEAVDGEDRYARLFDPQPLGTLHEVDRERVLGAWSSWLSGAPEGAVPRRVPPRRRRRPRRVHRRRDLLRGRPRRLAADASAPPARRHPGAPARRATPAGAAARAARPGRRRHRTRLQQPARRDQRLRGAALDAAAARRARRERHAIAAAAERGAVARPPAARVLAAAADRQPRRRPERARAPSSRRCSGA